MPSFDNPHDALRHHVSQKIAAGEAESITEQPTPARAKNASRDRSIKSESLIFDRHLKNLSPRQKLNLTKSILNQLLDSGISYADFQAAQHTERSIRKAKNALKHCG
jgi:hypothetical protein